MASKRERGLDLGLLVLRLGVASMLVFGHGLGKVLSFSEKAGAFPDPLGIGSPASLALAAFAEFVCAALVLLGWVTRWAAIPVVITMLVAAGIVHADDPWGKRELALMYAIPFLALVFTGAGAYSVDGARR